MLIEPDIDESKITERTEGDKTYISDGKGNEYLLRVGSMKESSLDLDPRIDLTKPIYEQAMRLWEEDGIIPKQAENSEADAA